MYLPISVFSMISLVIRLLGKKRPHTNKPNHTHTSNKLVSKSEKTECFNSVFILTLFSLNVLTIQHTHHGHEKIFNAITAYQSM